MFTNVIHEQPAQDETLPGFDLPGEMPAVPRPAVGMVIWALTNDDSLEGCS